MSDFEEMPPGHIEWIENATFSLAEASRLTGVSKRRLQRWDEEGLAPASLRSGGGGHRRYSAPDLQRIKIVAALRREGVRGARLRRQAEAILEALVAGG